MKRFRSLLPLLVLMVVGIGLFVSGVFDRFKPEHLVQEQTHLKELIAAYPIQSGLIQIGAVLLSTATGLPGTLVIILAGGMLFGFVLGTLLSTVGLTLGALILFLASRNAFGSHAGRQAPALVEKLRAGYLAHPLSYTLFLRLVPFFPFGGVTVALAWLRSPLWLFLSATVFGGTVMLAFETALGAGLAKTIAETGTIQLDLLAEPRIFLPILALGVLALTPVAISKLRKKH